MVDDIDREFLGFRCLERPTLRRIERITSCLIDLRIEGTVDLLVRFIVAGELTPARMTSYISPYG